MKRTYRILLLAAVLLLAACGNTGKTVYRWERSTKPAVRFADMTLCYGGSLRKEPVRWSADRFAPQVSFTDETGREQWLFEAFLCLDDWEGRTEKGLSLNPAPGRRNGNKTTWTCFLQYWLDPKQGALASLDSAVAAAAVRLGEPPVKRQVIMAMPDPVQFEIFADKTSSTTYWGDGLDFSRSADQVKAYRWYIDECRRLFAHLNPKYLELCGFYVLSEDLVARPDGLNYAYKRWDQILPPVAKYLHGLHYGFYWIPWNFAPGYDMTRELGFDEVWMQPNSYWDETGQKPMSRTVNAILEQGISMEFELEYSACTAVMKQPGMRAPDAEWNMTKTLADVPAFRERFREYLTAFRSAGLYGKKPIALYSGYNTIWQLARSPEPDDVAFYREICHYITDSPLRIRE